MDRPQVIASLRRLAEEHLNAPAYQDCQHRFSLFECDRCEADLFEADLERHPGDRPGDFMGRLHLKCARCGDAKVGLGIVSSPEADPSTVKAEPLLCTCGGRTFRLALCERWEDWGFFDEGTVVARCEGCGRETVVLDTD